MPVWLGCLIAFIYGTVVGSFLNVCIYRIPEEKSIVNPPSHCPKCEKRLNALDLVPLFSFLFLGRKCRYCGTPISWRYFTVELITGLLFVATYLVYGYSIDFFAYILFISALLIAFFVDLDRLIIPDQVVIAGIAFGVARDVAHIIAGDAKLMILPGMLSESRIPMLPSIAGAVVCGGAFYLLAYLAYFVFRPRGGPMQEEEHAGPAKPEGGPHLWLAVVLAVVLAPVLLFVAVALGPMARPIYVIGLIAYIACFVLKRNPPQGDAGEEEDYEGAIGGGDINLALAIGAVLGIGPAFVSFFVAIALGATVGLSTIILKSLAGRKGVEWRAQIPFGPHMAAGAIIVLLASPALVHIWESWIRLITIG